jgi:hypothetical protein
MSVLSERVYLMEQKQRYKEREQEQRKKEYEKAQRKREQKAERKQYEKDLIFACKKELKQKFEEEFNLQGLKAKYYFYKIENRENLIKSIAKSETEGDYLETNYNKFLNETIKKYELNEEYKREHEKELAQEYVEKMRPTWEEERKKKERKENTNAFLKLLWLIIKWIFIILFGGIYLLLKLIYTLACK